MTSSSSFYPKYKQLLPVSVWFVFSLLAISAAVIGETEGHTVTRLLLTVHHYVGFFFLLSLLVAFIWFRPYYKYVVFVALFAGIFDLANFSGAQFVYVFSSGIKIQPLSVIVGFLFLVINFNKFSALLEKYDPADERKFPFSLEEKVRFREKYGSYSNEELNTIRSNIKYCAEARRAAEELLSERVTLKN